MFVKKLLVFCLLIAACSSLGAQTFSQFKKAGDIAFKDKDYYAAMHYYENAALQKPDRLDLKYQWAESAQLFKAFPLALKLYKQVEQKGASRFPDLYLKQAECHLALSNYKEAENLLSSGMRQFDRERPMYKRTKFLLSSVHWALKQEVKQRFNSLILPLNLNSSYSDIAATIDNGNIYFSSLKYLDKKAESSRRKSRIYVYDLKGNQVSKLRIKGLSNERHWAHWTMNKAGDKAFFAQCEDLNASEASCKIYSADKLKGTWSNVQLLPERINYPQANTSQARLGEWNGSTCLFFSSDRVGGQGGMDIWFARILADGSFEEAQNFKEINTKGDEITPFFEEGVVYFSSNTRLGFGGYDIYKWTAKSGVENIGLPLNSSNDDLFFYKRDTSIYLSSNRTSAKQIDRVSDACCHDIFAFNEKRENRQREALVEIEQVIEVEKQQDESVVNKEGYEKKSVFEEELVVLEKESYPKTSNRKKPQLSRKSTTVYFDNDYPKLFSNEIDNSYERLYQEYISRKGSFYQINARNSNNEIDLFFTDSVEKGMLELEQFFTEMENHLQLGRRIEIKIIGYTSPRAKNDYNFLLSQRRIRSVEQYLLNRKGGVLKKYLSSKLLTIKQNPRGETTASKTISDIITDYTGSIYSIAASKERRVELILDIFP